MVLDNLYAFGRMNGAVMRPEGPFAPCSRKGALRLRLQERYRVDDAAFREAFGLVPTAFNDQVRATAEWARRTDGRA